MIVKLHNKEKQREEWWSHQAYIMAIGASDIDIAMYCVDTLGFECEYSYGAGRRFASEPHCKRVAPFIWSVYQRGGLDI